MQMLTTEDGQHGTRGGAGGSSTKQMFGPPPFPQRPTNSPPTVKQRFNKLPAWQRVSLIILGVVLITGILGNINPKPADTAAPLASTTISAPGAVHQTEPEVVAPQRESANVTGNGEDVVELGPTLSGKYKMEYAFGSWCGAIYFLNAAGESAQRTYGPAANGCSGNPDVALSGSAVVDLNNATMIQTENTRGNWMIKLTPLG